MPSAYLGAVDFVVNNDGIVYSHKSAEYPDDEFDRMLAVLPRGTWFGTQAAWPHSSALGRGRVVNRVSRGAFFGDPQGAA